MTINVTCISLTDPDVEEAFCKWCEEEQFGETTVGEAWDKLMAFEAGFLAAKSIYNKE